MLFFNKTYSSLKLLTFFVVESLAKVFESIREDYMCKHKYVNFVSGLLSLASSKDLKRQCSTWQYGISCKNDLGLWIVIIF